ncbi:MAG: lysoplasmalogenase, partial [Deltaproteobacteria bacterium]|nr:lysoplasmalogenase [Deltaproteobacteria bacterium]
MLNLLIVLTAIILLTVLLHYENRQNIKGLLSAKALLSSLFILAVLVQPHPITHYYHFLLSGLLLCLLGDICLAFQQEKMFLWGLISF